MRVNTAIKKLLVWLREEPEEAVIISILLVCTAISVYMGGSIILEN